jgi:transcriptional regulator with XRE-family HTH domain
VTREQWLSQFGAAVKAARLRNGYRQRDIAEYLGVTRPWVANIEAGRRDCSASAAAQLTTLLGFALPGWSHRWPQ